MSFEQRNKDFCKAQTDVQMAYIEAEREVRQLKAENARLKQELEAVGTAAYLYGRTDIADENAKLREQTELLVTLLRNDCDIEASWDGLRHFWSIELTDDGCLMRDRACKAEAENAKLRELLQRLLAEYRYLRVRPRKMYLQHEQRMRAIEDEMCELGIEVPE